MRTKIHHNVTLKCNDWNLEDKQVQRGLSRLLQDLKALMTEEEFQQVLRIQPVQKGCPVLPDKGVSDFIPVLAVKADGRELTSRKISGKKSARHAA